MKIRIAVIVSAAVLAVLFGALYLVYVRHISYTVVERIYGKADDVSRGYYPQYRWDQQWLDKTHEIIVRELGKPVTFSGLELNEGARLRAYVRLLEKDYYKKNGIVADVRPPGGGNPESLGLKMTLTSGEGRETAITEQLKLGNAEGQVWTVLDIPLGLTGHAKSLNLVFNPASGARDGRLVVIKSPEINYGVTKMVLKTSKHRQVIFITLDTTRADYIGCYGDDYTKTPNLDALGSDGVIFTNCFSTVNNTKPSHASMFTSLYIKDHGVIYNGMNMPDDPRMIARVFKAAGFRTAAFVSCANFETEKSGFDQGFDDYYYYDKFIERSAEDTNYFVLNWLNEHRDDDFFVWIHYFDPHMPYTPPYPFNVMYDRKSGEKIGKMEERIRHDYTDYFKLSDDVGYYKALYRGEVSYMDGQMGVLFDRLKDLGIYDDTTVVVVADHGESLGEHGIYFDHAGIYDTTVHVPLIIKPNGMKHGGIREQLVSSVDIYPTLMEMYGINVRYPIRGISLSGIMRNASTDSVRKEVFSEHARHVQISVRDNSWLFIKHLVNSDALPEYHFVKDKKELYDRGKDPMQLHDVSSDNQGVMAVFDDMVTKFSSDVMPHKVGKAADKEHLEKIKALGYVQ